MTGPAVVQQVYVDARNTNPQLTFGGSLTAGNLVIAAAWFGDGGSFFTADQGGWTFISQTAVGSGAITLWGRIVAGGDGTGSGYSAFSSSNTNNTNACAGYEISNAAASVGASVELSNVDVFTAGHATDAITTQTTGNANDLACLFAFAELVVFPSQPTLGSPFSNDAGHAGFTETGAIGHKSYVSSGSSVNCTITWNSTDSKNTAALFIIKSASAGETANPVTLALSGVSFNSVAPRIETGNATLALGGVKFNAQAEFEAETFAATLALSGISIKANVVDVSAEPTLVNFYVF